MVTPTVMKQAWHLLIVLEQISMLFLTSNAVLMLMAALVICSSIIT